jgi:ATP-dependent DNA helicase RecG
MSFIEDSNTELKREFVSDIKKTAVAFANTSGGKIYIGIADGGEVIGADLPDTVSRQVASCIRDSIKPDITRFFDIRTEDINRSSRSFFLTILKCVYLMVGQRLIVSTQG